MMIVIVALGICLIASMVLNFRLIDELERVEEKLEEAEQGRVW